MISPTSSYLERKKNLRQSRGSWKVVIRLPAVGEVGGAETQVILLAMTMAMAIAEMFLQHNKIAAVHLTQNVKLSLSQAVEVHRFVRRRSFHIF
jgi:hypothetical protein